MTFTDTYSNAIKTTRMVNITPEPNLLIPTEYRYSSTDYRDYLHLLGGGNIYIDVPFALSFMPLHCYLMIYTLSGAGSLTCQGERTELSEGSFVFFDCNRNFSINSLVHPWNFKLFFFDGNDMKLFYPARIRNYIVKSRLKSCSGIVNALSRLSSLRPSVDDEELILMHSSITDIMASLCVSSDTLPYRMSGAAAPYNYLNEVSEYIRCHYPEELSLTRLEDIFGVSRYRICREFGAAFNISPQKYIASVRMNEAKKMLLNTNWTVHEISSKVGYENVTHFINMFKKSTGLTPNMFRQTVRVEQFS